MEVVAMVLEGGELHCHPQWLSPSVVHCDGYGSRRRLPGQDHRAVVQRAGGGVLGTRPCQIEHDDCA
jgi:hypothetical protein